MQENSSNSSQEQKPKSWLDSIRNLPEGKRKIIFWFLMIIISLFLINIYLKNVGKTLKQGIEFPNFQFPKIEVPEI